MYHDTIRTHQRITSFKSRPLPCHLCPDPIKCRDNSRIEHGTRPALRRKEFFLARMMAAWQPLPTRRRHPSTPAHSNTRTVRCPGLCNPQHHPIGMENNALQQQQTPESGRPPKRVSQACEACRYVYNPLPATVRSIVRVVD